MFFVIVIQMINYAVNTIYDKPFFQHKIRFYLNTKLLRKIKLFLIGKP